MTSYASEIFFRIATLMLSRLQMTSCEKARKRKELEVEILSRNVIGCEGNLVSAYGTPLAATNALWQVDSGGVFTDLKERILLLYPTFLLTFSYLSDKDQYKFEGKHSLSNLQIENNLNDQFNQNSDSNRMIELTGSLLQKIIITFPTVVEYNNWKELLECNTGKKSLSSPLNLAWASSRASVSNINPISLPNNQAYTKISNIHACNPKKCIRPHGTRKPLYCESSATAAALIDGTRSFRKHLKNGKKSKVHAAVDVTKRFESCESDALLLSIIESYHKCSTNAKLNHRAKAGQLDSLVSSSNSDSIVVYPYEQSVANTANITTSINDRNIVVAVAHINQQMRELQAALRNLKRDLSEEKKARIKLEKDLEYDRGEGSKINS
ncbi:hypothetical protein GJ496_002464 [Pomphorhynchus laevis]|nr:hypothetical protein GJ496_002464 [Pomphorhynchus laevis]